MARIEATGRYMPEKIVTNDYFSGGAGLYESIEEYLTGYDQRRHADPNEYGLDLLARAAQSAIESSIYQPEDIDLIVGCIVPNQHLYGEDLNLLQHKLGAKNASVLPINTTCSTFISALNIADSAIKAGKKKCVLIAIAVDWVKNGFDTKEPNYAFAGDGAAAVIVDGEGDSFIDVLERNNSTPSVFSSMTMKNPLITGKKEYFKITEPDGVSTAKDLVLAPVLIAKELLERNPALEVDKIFMHQSGLKMMNMWIDKLGLSFSKVKHTLDLYANMSAASIPCSLDYWIKKGEVSRGENVLFFAPATGGHYIAMLWRY